MVSQCPFGPYWAGAKVYRAYQAGRRPRWAAYPTDNPNKKVWTLGRRERQMDAQRLHTRFMQILSRTTLKQNRI